MRTNRIIRNTIIGLSTLIGSSNFSPSIENSAIKNIEKVPTKYTQIIKYTNTGTETTVGKHIKVPYKPLPLQGATVMVNPGHGIVRKDGSFDYGKVIKKGRKQIKESDLNDNVGENVRRKLEKLGAKIIYVDNTEVHAIQALENQYNPDVFVALHHDAKADGPKAKNAGETMYAWGKKSYKLAKSVNKWFKKDSIIPNNGIDSTWAKHLCVLNADSKTPALLVEGGFMTNKSELKILNTQDYQNKEAQNIVQGIRDFIEHKWAEEKEIKKAEEIAKTPKLRLLFEKVDSPFKFKFDFTTPSADKDI